MLPHLIGQTITATTEPITAGGVVSNGTPSLELLSPAVQSAWPQTAEGRPQSRRKQSVVELFSRTDHRDMED